jgi:hypothetical protein
MASSVDVLDVRERHLEGMGSGIGLGIGLSTDGYWHRYWSGHAQIQIQAR